MAVADCAVLTPTRSFGQLQLYRYAVAGTLPVTLELLMHHGMHSTAYHIWLCHMRSSAVHLPPPPPSIAAHDSPRSVLAGRP